MKKGESMGLLDFVFDNFLLNTQFLLGALVTTLFYLLIGFVKKRAKSPNKLDFLFIINISSFIMIDQSKRWNVSKTTVIICYIIIILSILYVYSTRKRAKR